MWQAGNLPDKLKNDADIFASTVTYPQAIEITSPNGGESIKRGTTKKVKWTTTLSPGARVRVEVWRNGQRAWVDGMTKNDGLYKLLIPDGTTVGEGYTIRIQDKADHTLFDESDGTFRIK